MTSSQVFSSGNLSSVDSIGLMFKLLYYSSILLIYILHTTEAKGHALTPNEFKDICMTRPKVFTVKDFMNTMYTGGVNCTLEPQVLIPTIQELLKERNHLREEFQNEGLKRIIDDKYLVDLHVKLALLEFRIQHYFDCVIEGERWSSASFRKLVSLYFYGKLSNFRPKLIRERESFLKGALNVTKVDMNKQMLQYTKIIRMAKKMDNLEKNFQLERFREQSWKMPRHVKFNSTYTRSKYWLDSMKNDTASWLKLLFGAGAYVSMYYFSLKDEVVNFPK